MKFIFKIHNSLKSFERVDFVPLLFLRLYLFYVLWFAGVGKIDSFDKFSGYLGTLGVPLPDIFTWLVIITEAGGAALLLVGLFVRWVTIPLLIVMFFCWIFSSLSKWLAPRSKWHRVCCYIQFDAFIFVMFWWR